MDSFTERMVERAHRHREQLKMRLKNPVVVPVVEVSSLKDSIIINKDNNQLSSDKLCDVSKTLYEVEPVQDVENIPVDKTSVLKSCGVSVGCSSNSEVPFSLAADTLLLNSQFYNSNSTLAPPVSEGKSTGHLNLAEDFSVRVGSVLEKASVYETIKSSKKSTTKDPCELSVADRKALFEKNKGQALIPKVPFGQPLPAHKTEVLGNNLPLNLPPKLPLRCAPPRQSGSRIQTLGNSIPNSSPPSPPPKPDHLKAFMESVKSGENILNDEASSIISEHKEQDTSYESIASSESSLGQKIVRLAQKRSKEIEDSKKQTNCNSQSQSSSKSELGFCSIISNEALSDIHESGPTPPKQCRIDSIGILPSTYSNHESSGEIESNQKYQENFSDSEQPFSHTVSFYRKIQNQNEKPGASLVKKVVHQSINSIGLRYSELNEKIEKEAVNNKIAELLQKISAETTIISQATQALNLCFSSVEFNDSAEQIEAERLLLLATHRRQAAMNEVQRLRVEGTVKPNEPNSCTPSDQGSLTVSEITLPVKLDAVRIAAREEKCHHFVCLLKCDEVVLGTSIITATDKDLQETSKGIMHMQFQNVLIFPKLYSDFKVTVEIYDLLARSKEALPHDVKYHISNKKDLSKFRITPKKQKVSLKLTAPVVPPLSGSSCITTSKFSMIGYIVFSLREVQRTQFTLNKVTYSNPLEGKVQLKLSCELSPSVERRGFLTMFEDVSGFGAWHRRWCLLKGDSLSYWKYPDDERTKLPIDTIDLNTCTAQTITAVNRDICARPNTFLLETIRPARDEDVDSLVLVRHAAHTMVRYLLSTDTKEERIEWCSTLNKALEILRAWRRK